MKSKVLLIEDLKHIHQDCAEAIRMSPDLKDYWQILSAYTEEEARILFLANTPDIKLILLDGCLNTYTPNTLELLKWMRDQYKGLIIAISAGFNEALVQAGCDRAMQKHLLSEKLPGILYELGL